MRIDLHVHTSDWSDGKDSAEDVIVAAIERGLDGIVISDHHRMLQKDEQQALRARFPGFAVFRGAEITIRKDHINLIGGSGDAITAPRPHNEDFLQAYTAATGALAMFNHPFYNGDVFIDLDRFCPEVMDIASMNTDTSRKEQYMEIARERRMALAAGSDTHCAAQVGMFHVVLDNRVETDEQLVAELRAGRLSIGTFDDMLIARQQEVMRAVEQSQRAMAEGVSTNGFSTQGASPPGKRVRSADSYMPPAEFMGMRGDRFTGG